MCAFTNCRTFALAFALIATATMCAEPVQPYNTYLAAAVNLGTTKVALTTAYPDTDSSPPAVVMPPEANYQVHDTLLPTLRPLRLVSFHLVRDRLVAIGFAGGVPASYPGRNALLVEFRTSFLQGFTKQTTETYSMPIAGGVKTLTVETWAVNDSKKALFVERDDFAQIIVFDPGHISKTVLLPWLSDPDVTLIGGQ